MQAEIITIGDELLIGQVIDTNSAWLGSTLGNDGIKVIQITSVQDNASQIVRAVNDALSRADIVLMTGGLGPTKDDITKKTLAEMFGMKLVRDEQVYAMVGKQLALRGIAFTELNQGQALVPDGCTVLPNRNGTAPGMWFERNEEVLPRLRKHFALDANVHRTIITFGLAESILADTIAPWEEALPPYLHLAYLPSALCIRLRLSAYETDRQKAEQEIDNQLQKLAKLIPHYIVGSEEDSLESVTGQLLRDRGETLATAESCTGGNIAHRFTAMPGASDYFKGGVVAYSNEVKMALLGVDPESLNQYGAVSQSVAEQMAEGVRRATGATYGISTTGIAGPTGGTPDKPVGTVWMAVATPHGVFSRRMVFGSIRSQNIERASSNCINLLRLHLLGFSNLPLSDNV